MRAPDLRMPKIALGIEYDGSEFFGWQAQRGQRSVQAELAAAVAKVADERVVVHGAGRTDTGVHALQQVVHFSTSAARSPRQWVLGVNANLPGDVRVQWATPVAEDFDARRSALFRRYRYLLLEANVDSPLLRRRVWRVRDPLHVPSMSAAAVAWLGENDFSSFRAAGCQSRTPMRRLTAVSVERAGRLVALEFEANAFLHHMVRNLMGALVEVGKGGREPDWMSELLAHRDRRLAPPTFSSAGLYLARAEYPARYRLPSLPVEASLETHLGLR